jgi:hypothetical protein
MLNLPDGTILLTMNDNELYVYQPDGSPLPAGQPVINTLTQIGNGTYQLTGTLFNGLNEGNCYGDDVQMNCNYSLVRMTNYQGKVYYARTYNWNSTGVMTGTNIVNTDFVPPPNASYGIYTLVVTAEGNASAPVTFYYSPDPLLVTSTNTLLFIGTNGGPFAPSSLSITLTNVGAASLNWSAGTTSSWLHVSSASGSLTPGGTATTLSLSLNASANTLPFGTYATTLWITNTNDHYVWSESVTLVAYPSQLVQDGGFESGNFIDWTQSGDVNDSEYVYDDPPIAHSGNYLALIQAHTGLFYLSQNLTTTPGQPYLVSFWILNESLISPSQFLVNWAGTNLVNLNPVPTTGFAWENMQYVVTAISASSQLQIGIQYDANPSSGDYIGLDDVSVTALPIPTFQPATKSTGSITLTWTAMYNQSYQLQYTTNLFSPVWNNLGNPITASNATVTTTDFAPTNSQRFYHLVLLP